MTGETPEPLDATELLNRDEAKRRKGICPMSAAGSDLPLSGEAGIEACQRAGISAFDRAVRVAELILKHRDGFAPSDVRRILEDASRASRLIPDARHVPAFLELGDRWVLARLACSEWEREAEPGAHVVPFAVARAARARGLR